MELSRRRFLGAAGASAGLSVLGVALPRSAQAAEASGLPDFPFTLGVASGDMTPDSVVLWTRLAPQPMSTTFGMADQPDTVEVNWAITPANGDGNTYRGVVTTRRSEAYSVHVDVNADGAHPLQPNKRYTFKFTTAKAGGGLWVAEGSTRTTPGPDGASVSVRFGVLCCHSAGKVGKLSGTPTLSHAAAAGLDFMVANGDYIYEFASAWAPSGSPLASVCTTKNDYRLRYAYYRSQIDGLKQLHKSTPFYCTVDDHEFYDNVHGGQTGASDRFQSALVAYWENMPIRAVPRMTGGRMVLDLDKNIRWGKTLDLYMSDGRQFRNIAASPPTMLGSAQTTRLLDHIGTSDAVYSGFISGTPFNDPNGDKWGGFTNDRGRVRNALRARADKQRASVIISGDIHVGAVVDDPSGAAEFICPAVSSNPGDRPSYSRAGYSGKNGYLLNTVGPQSWQTEYVVGNPGGAVSTAGTWRVRPTGELQPG